MTAPVSRTMMPLRALVAARPSGTNRGLLHPLSNVK